MKISMDNGLSRLLPWELQFTLGGKDYPTRPLSMWELGVIINASRNPNDPAALQSLIDVMGAIFVGDDKPDIKTWLPEHFAIVANGVTEYYREWQRKNSRTPAATDAAGVKATTAQRSDSGNS